MSDVEQLSPRWRYAVISTFILGFAVLILLTFKAYQNAPPIPARVIDASGAVVFTGDDVRHGLEVFLKYGLMDNGTLWGHGGYLGPDFGATVLHDWALALAENRAQARAIAFWRSFSASSISSSNGVAACGA
jgi:nitric oxide reductase subunit B